MSRRFAFVFTFIAVLAAAPLVAQQAPTGMTSVAAKGLTWGDIEVPGFLPGMKIAVLNGDPSVADQPYTLRLMLPDGYRFPPHFHPKAENVTVVEGTFLLRMGRTFEESNLVKYMPGDYLYIRAEHPHYGGAIGRTVIQLHGIGPFDIKVVEGQEMVSK